MLTPVQVNTAPSLKGEKPMKEDRPEKVGPLDDTKMTPVLGHTPDLSQPKPNDTPELLTNEIMVDKGKRHGGRPGGSVC